MAINFFPKLNFTEFLNRNVRIVFTKFEGKRLTRRCSVLLIFPIFDTFVCTVFSPRTASTQPNFKKNVWKLESNLAESTRQDGIENRDRVY